MSRTHNVIIVQRDAVVAADFLGILEESGHRVVGVARGLDDALDHADVAYVDLVFVDVDAVGEDHALDIARILIDRHHARAVLIGSKLRWEFMQDCRYYRPVGFIQKPYTAEAIRTVFAQDVSLGAEFQPAALRAAEVVPVRPLSAERKR